MWIHVYLHPDKKKSISHHTSYFNSIQWCFSCPHRSNCSPFHYIKIDMLTKVSSIPYSVTPVILLNAPFQAQKLRIPKYIVFFIDKINFKLKKYYAVVSCLSWNQNIVTIPQTVILHVRPKKKKGTIYNFSIIALISIQLWSYPKLSSEDTNLCL